MFSHDSNTRNRLTQTPDHRINLTSFRRSHSLQPSCIDQNKMMFSRSHALPSARIDSGAKSLYYPDNGDVSFKVIGINETGGEDGRLYQLSNIESDQNGGFQATVEDRLRGTKRDMRLKVPEGEQNLGVGAVRDNLGGGRYKAKMLRDSEGEQVCQLRENDALEGGGKDDL